MSDLEIVDNTDPYYYTHHTGHVISGTHGVYCPGVDGFFEPHESLTRGDDCPACGDELDC